MEARLIGGNPRFVNYTPSADVAAGTVVVIGTVPYVAHVDLPAGQPGALASRGGVYEMVAGGNYAPGGLGYFNNTSKKIVQAGVGSVHFGYITPMSDPAADGDPVIIEHAPTRATL